MGYIRTLRSKKLNPEHVEILNEAIRHNAKGGDKTVHISYKKENGEVSERKVRPLAVKGKSLFMAHCHERNAIRSFRVERINMVKHAFWDGFEKRAALSPEQRGAYEKELNDHYIKTRGNMAFKDGVAGAAVGGLLGVLDGLSASVLKGSVSSIPKNVAVQGLKGLGAGGLLGAGIGTGLGVYSKHKGSSNIKKLSDKVLERKIEELRGK